MDPEDRVQLDEDPVQFDGLRGARPLGSELVGHLAQSIDQPADLLVFTIQRLHPQPAGEEAVELGVHGLLDHLHVGNECRREEAALVGDAGRDFRPG